MRLSRRLCVMLTVPWLADACYDRQMTIWCPMTAVVKYSTDYIVLDDIYHKYTSWSLPSGR